jgi:hypothetical protein
MLLDNAFGEIEAQTRAPLAIAKWVLNPGEFPEQLFHVFFRDSHPSVGY